MHCDRVWKNRCSLLPSAIGSAIFEEVVEWWLLGTFARWKLNCFQNESEFISIVEPPTVLLLVLFINCRLPSFINLRIGGAVMAEHCV